ncbi:MAG: bifunctional DNA-formamidopyrimidine glycosylase/DNA-(apurinic or apyrimidinic site) lyase [Chloroflexi bacterium]|nr:MAG: bifunctional DNA-formamidopyrimidine glycosylase/DNA-(apurinic or apyrimidinic site) lyase [Chloroflexota bacterium]
MPELPEVEATARSLRPRLVGQRVSRVHGVDWPRMLPNTSEEELNSSLSSRRVVSVGRRGKYLLVGFDDDRWLAIHRKMSGNLILQPAADPTEPHTHLGRVYLFGSSDELDDFLAERLGPDSLIELDEKVLASKLRGRKARLKPLLLDQSFVAGVGNLYADEALWEARLHPLRSADSLSAREVRRLAQAIKHVLSTAIERRGTSFSTYRDSDGLPGENQDFLSVYGREGQPCPRCGTPISRIMIGQRSSYFCPRDQKER